ncbi:septation protein SepH [Nocardioides sp. Bht2]|uniref:septation protein SepH n=1 Tax=Nocardioides sp. Bht2 TaxID=3392297 RepID=UPI0039B6AAB3
MLHLTLAGLSEDNACLLLVSESGEEFSLTLDAKLRAAVRGTSARSGRMETQMESTLRPRDIQARIRAGESPESVAQSANTTVDKIEAFAGPVLAERAHIAERAQRSSVRRKTGDTGARTLGDAVSAQLRPHNVRSANVEWDAWRREDGRWTLQAVYTAGTNAGTGHFSFDVPGNYVVADDDDARWLVGEPVHRPEAPAPRDDLARFREARQSIDDALVDGADDADQASHDADTLGADALALVQQPAEATAEPVEPAGDADEPTIDLSETVRAAGKAPLQAAPPAEAPAIGTAPANEPAGATAEANDSVEEEPAAKPAPRKANRRKRASVPSWDEIMFGGGKQE